MSDEKFINPFDARISYELFLIELKKSKKTIAEYCKGKLEKDQIDWLENEIKTYKKIK